MHTTHKLTQDAKYLRNEKVGKLKD